MAQQTLKRQRRCIGCGKRANKAELYRIVRTTNGDVRADGSGKEPGRGTYVCSRPCLIQSLKTQKIDRALRVTLKDEDRARLLAILESNIAASH